MVNGYIYLDNNYDKVFNAGDSGENMITVFLMTTTGLVLSSGQTNGSGFYIFTGLLNSGDYIVSYLTSDIDLIGSTDSSQWEDGNQSPPPYYQHLVPSMDFIDFASINNNFGLILPPTPPTPPGG